MSRFSKPRFWIVAGVVLVALLIAQQFWHWEIERVEVLAGEYLVVTNYWGKNLGPDEVVAPDDSYKGVQAEVLLQGRHFINPLMAGYQRHKYIDVPNDQCLVLCRLFGKPIPQERLERGEILAEEGERGILEKVLGPGSYALNPYAYHWKLEKAVVVAVDQVGVRTRKVGKNPAALQSASKRGPYVVPEDYRGVQEKVVGPGTYYLNPHVESIVPVEVRSHRVELADIEFPSRDGFILKPHVVVEYRVMQEKAPETFVRLTDEGKLHQEDQTPQDQEKNQVLQKVILPHVRGYARIEGSNFDARDFILAAVTEEKAVANHREMLQKKLLERVKSRCEELGVEILAVTLADMTPPAELADQISQRDLARVEQERNKVKLVQIRESQKLRATQALKTQNKEKVMAQTRKIEAEKQAELQKQQEELKLKQRLESAQLRLDAAKAEAQAVLTNAKADADVIMAENEAEVAGLRTAVQGSGGAANYAQYQMLQRLAPALAEIFASDESEFAKIFSAYMTPVPQTDVPRVSGSKR